MFEKLGKRKYVVPFVIPIVLIFAFSLMFYPLARMEVKDLPFGVLSLDEGVELPTGEVNVGGEMVGAIESGEGLGALTASESEATDGGAAASVAGAISWRVFDSQQALDEAFSNGEIYGAIVIPEDFTLSRVAEQLASSTDTSAASQSAGAQVQGGSQTAAGQAQADPQAMAAQAQAMVELKQRAEAAGEVSLQVYLDNAKSPLIASQMKTNNANLFLQNGVSAEVAVFNDGGYEIDFSSPIASVLSLQLAIFPSVIGGFAAAIVLSRVFTCEGESAPKKTAINLGKQVISAAFASLIVALCAWCAVAVVAGVQMPFANSVMFLWLGVFCFVILLLGALSVSFPFGVLVAVCTLALGNMTGVLPFEALPTLWQDFVFPWVPQRFMGEGVRAVMYLGEGVLNAGTLPLIAIAAVGLALMLVRLGVAAAKSRKGGEA